MVFFFKILVKIPKKNYWISLLLFYLRHYKIVFQSFFKHATAWGVFFFLCYLFILRDREKERVCMHVSRGGTQREKSQAGFALSAQSLMCGSIPQTMRSWPELKSRVRCLTDRATQAPQHRPIIIPRRVVCCLIKRCMYFIYDWSWFLALKYFPQLMNSLVN